jgi:hypothetical protein
MAWHKSGGASVKTPHVSVPKATVPKAQKAAAHPHPPKAPSVHHTTHHSGHHSAHHAKKV